PPQIPFRISDVRDPLSIPRELHHFCGKTVKKRNELAGLPVKGHQLGLALRDHYENLGAISTEHGASPPQWSGGQSHWIGVYCSEPTSPFAVGPDREFAPLVANKEEVSSVRSPGATPALLSGR